VANPETSGMEDGAEDQGFQRDHSLNESAGELSCCRNMLELHYADHYTFLEISAYESDDTTRAVHQRNTVHHYIVPLSVFDAVDHFLLRVIHPVTCSTWCYSSSNIFPALLLLSLLQYFISNLFTMCMVDSYKQSNYNKTPTETQPVYTALT